MELTGIKNIVFDFGGIIVDLDRQAAVDAFARLGAEVEDCVGYYAQKGLFADLETGRATERDFVETLRGTVCRGTPDEEILKAWNCMLKHIPAQRLEVIHALRGHYRTFLLSNTNAPHWDYARHALQPQGAPKLEDCFERTFLSYRMGLAKPDKEIFLRMAAEAGLHPQETLFIDDSEANIHAAEALGIRAFHSRKPDDWQNISIIKEVTNGIPHTE